MAKVRIKNFDQFRRKLSAELVVNVNKVFSNRVVQNKIGDIIVEDIKANVDLGSAAPSTRKVREYLEKYNATDSQYNRNRIKALFTGALLEDLRRNVLGEPTKGQFIIDHSTKRHPGYKTATGRTKGPRFDQIKGYLFDKGYDYFRLTDKATQEILSLIKDEISRAIGAS